MHKPIPFPVALARHRPTSEIGRYDEETCDGRLPDGTRTITLLRLTSDEVLVVSPARDVDIISYQEEP